MGGGDIGDEVDEAGAAEELGEENGGVGLRFRGLDAVKTLAEHAGLAAAFALHWGSTTISIPMILFISRFITANSCMNIAAIISSIIFASSIDHIERCTDRRNGR
ncbi:hypothetical protein Droror1_Dr00009230 [Drosera rotundifolia]